MIDFTSARKQLLDWYRKNKRSLPWRDTHDPYKIWISEIMLQQTRVDQAMPYFRRFMECFPTVYRLAEASQEDVLRVWEGLGYYSRARNMHYAAGQIVREYNGNIPDSMEKIRKLKGIGPYTSAAILSIAYGKPHAVVDGNVIRVLSRFVGIEKDVRKPAVVKEIQDAADRFLDDASPGDFNQAMMELGATVCTPKSPLCSSCPLQSDCFAHREKRTTQIPYKSPAKKRPHKHIAVGVIRDKQNRFLIARRPENVMLGGLWEFPGGKQEKGEKIKQTLERELLEELGVRVNVESEIMQIKHGYSHFTITLHAYFCSIVAGNPQPKSSQALEWVYPEELKDYPFPKANRLLTETLMK